MKMAGDEAGCLVVNQILFAGVSYTVGSGGICVSAHQAFDLLRSG